MAEDNEDNQYKVGHILLGYDNITSEWKNCEIISINNNIYNVHFLDTPIDNITSLNIDQLQYDNIDEDDEIPTYQVGDQLFGYNSEDGSWYPCEIVDVLETGYKVHFFETPDDEIVELAFNEVIEEQVLPDDTPIFAYLEDTEQWYHYINNYKFLFFRATGQIVKPTDDGYEVHLDSAPQDSTIVLSDENIYPIDFVAGSSVLAWKESPTNPSNVEEGTWENATLKGIIDTGYQVQFEGSRDICDLSPDRVRPVEDSYMESDD